ncbi:MAG: TnsA endonuclease C-terminal domain-containing protein [Vallitalea sp.]|nr:TnsA endonuclease C-terminal domain-containing protein [Vallitalea sp.]MCT4686862.1 TnsA endonuclease C-terminal domain-containing protein [Vallitalea sp.]
MYLRGFYDINNQVAISKMSQRNKIFLLDKLQDIVTKNKQLTLRDVLFTFDQSMSLELGTSITLFNHLVYKKKLKVNLLEKLDYNKYQSVSIIEKIEKQVKSG